MVSKEILKRKYFKENEDFEGFVNRVCSIFSRNQNEIKQALINGDFFPAGRILNSAGLEKDNISATPMNCYVLPSPEDNIESIYKTQAEMAKTFSRGGGCGINISNLRPKDAKVNNTAKTTSGATSFLELFNTTGSVIGQNGRRAAIMIGLNCSHPDIEEFLHIKETNHKLEHMNISILFTDEFMQAVRDGKDYTCSFFVPETGEKIEKTINAKEFFKRFCKVNWDYGDPGAMFIDTIRKNNLLSGYDDYKIEISNPCFTSDMKLLTTKGYIPFKELEGKTVRVIKPNGEISSKDSPVFKTGTKKVISLMIGATRKSTLKEIKCTPNHIFKTFDGNDVAAKDLKGKRLQIPKVSNYTSNEELKYERLGFIQGDGCYHHTKGRNVNGITVFIGEKDGDVKDIFNGFLSNGSNNAYMVTSLKSDIQKIGIEDKPLCYRNLPKNYNSLSKNLKASFLKGLFSANGCVIYSNNTKRVQFKTTNKILAMELVKELDTFDIKSYITTNKKTMVSWKNGDYESRESYDVNISQSYSLLMFYQQIGFIQKYKMEKLYNLVCSLKIKVIDIIDKNEIVDVFDFTEYDAHWGVVEGIVAHNCSEFLGSAYTACCLGSINLYNCVDNKFSPNAEFNFEKFNNLVSIGVDALNQVLDYGRDKQPLEANKKAIDDWRNIGLGFFGLADALVALGIRYGSKEAQALLYSISKIMMLKALDSSWNLAALQGTFKKYNWEKTKKSKIISNLKGTLLGNSLYEGIKEDGLANGSLISIAPTGTISLLAGGFSGGIEPMFKVSYERTTHTLEGKGETFRVFPTSIKELLEYHNLPLTLTNEEIKEKFSHIVEADEIPYVERIGMQASTQRPIDNAISSTINLPESATPEDIFNIYMMAWEARLKGITVFRDGCMRLSILNPKKKSEDFDNNFGEIVPMKRDTMGSLPSLTYKKQSACSKLYPTITFKDGKPFEVFASVTGGCSANIATIVRLSSLALRCGVKPEKLIEELKEQKCPACKTLRGQGRKNISLSCGNAIAESLQEAVVEFNGEFKEKTNIKQPKQTDEVHEERVRKKCPECGAEIRAEGNCVSCTQCSWSKCE